MRRKITTGSRSTRKSVLSHLLKGVLRNRGEKLDRSSAKILTSIVSNTSVLILMRIHSNAKLRFRCPSSLTGYDDSPDSRRCLIRIPRRIIFFSILSFCPSLCLRLCFLTDRNGHADETEVCWRINAKMSELFIPVLCRYTILM